MLGYISNRLASRKEKKALHKLAYGSSVKMPSRYVGKKLPDHPVANQADIAAYDLTKGMQDYLNRTRGYTGLCFNELSETELRLNGYDTPAFGRRFEVHFNALPLGHLEFSAGFDLKLNYGRRQRENAFEIGDINNLLRLDYEFRNLEVLKANDAKSMLIELIELMLPADDIAASRAKARTMAVEIMTDYLWDLERAKNFEDDGLTPIAEVMGAIDGNAGIYFYATEDRPEA
ncbi:hypothetical protein OE810_13225 [Rhodobacteraceae bacterium XHP0102]|nr:hypothetical protein [Rhodobacteraceae bacterium XHP0102]